MEADKGFNYSVVDDAFVCQKKNHFQVEFIALAFSYLHPPTYCLAALNAECQTQLSSIMWGQI